VGSRGKSKAGTASYSLRLYFRVDRKEYFAQHGIRRTNYIGDSLKITVHSRIDSASQEKGVSWIHLSMDARKPSTSGLGFLASMDKKVAAGKLPGWDTIIGF
jgi:hypothetical protein